MAKRNKKASNNVFEIAFTERDREIMELELQRSEVEEDLEDAIKEFVKISKQRQFKRKKKRLSPLLKDGINPDKLKP